MIDWPHMIATCVVIFVVHSALMYFGVLEGKSRTRQVIIGALSIGLGVFALNLAWPPNT